VRYYTRKFGYGIRGYDLLSTSNSAVAFDFDHTGKMDHIVLYRPGTGTIWILKHDGDYFIPVFRQGDPGDDTGIGGFNFDDPVDAAFAFDYDGTSRQDHLVVYRPGTGVIEIMKNTGGAFTPCMGTTTPAKGSVDST
jgi:hypothetical protein